MKKNYCQLISVLKQAWRSKLFRIMRLACFLIVFSIVQVLAGSAYSQNTKLSLNLRDTSVKFVLQQIEDQSQFFFIYDATVVDVNKKVNIFADNELVTKILDELFEGSNIVYKINNRQIALTTNSLSSVSQQSHTVSGKVTDSSGLPLPGVTVIIKGTTSGIITDNQGKYNLLNVPANATLQFSFVGMKTQEVQVSGKTGINVTMAEEAIGIEEVVAIGYGTMKKTDVTGSVASVNESDFKDKTLTNISKALVGQVAGLDVVSSGSDPGSGSQIRLRGRRSFVASNDPLIILDGIPYYGAINDINPYDITSVDVLKDASSTAIYGSQGANGVIIITTKRGRVGKAQFSVESFGGIVSIHGKLPVYNGAEFAERARESARAAGTYPNDGQIHDDIDKQIFTSSIEYDNMKAGNSVDWQDMILQNGYQQKHQISVNGGSEAVKYNFAGNIYDEEGIIPTNKFDRYSLRSNLDFTISSKFTVGSSVMMQYHINSSKLNSGNFDEAYQQSPLGSPYESDGITPRFDPNNDGYRKNPLSDLLWDDYRSHNKSWSAFANVYAEYKILPSLTYRLNLGANVDLGTNKLFAGPYTVTRRGDVSNATIDNNVNTRKTYESILTFNKKIKDHSIQLTGVHSILSSRWEYSGLNTSKIPYEVSLYNNVGTAELINSVGSNLTETALISYVGRLFYGYKDKYLLQFTMRADGASQFAAHNKWGYFPSASFAWRISEEGFLKSADWLSNLKLRLGYGIAGNRAISPYQSGGGLTKTTYSWGETVAAFGQKPSTLANKDLKWESTKAYNLGIDFGLIHGRINGNIDLYSTNTYDLLMYRQLPVTTGYSNVLQNVGQTSNKGIEIGLNTVNIDKGRFQWNSNLNFSLNREEIVELYQGKVDDIGSGWFIGHPISVYYDYKKIGIWQLGEEAGAAVYGMKPGDIKLLDVNDDKAITDKDRMIIGSQQPKFVLNLTNSFVVFNNWDLSFDTYVRWGQTAQVGGFSRESVTRLNSLKLDYWTPNNPTNKQPRPNNGIFQYVYGGTLQEVDGSFIKLRQITVGYTIPGTLLSKLNISKTRIYLTGENLWYWTKTADIKHFNLEPEISGGIQTKPAQLNIIAGINITF